MMDIRFLNNFGEVAQENLIAVIKQNLVFQAQIKLLTEENKKIEEYEKAIAEFEPVKDHIVRLNEENVNLRNQLEARDSLAGQFNKTDAERHRLQTAVNDLSREKEGFVEMIRKMQDEILANKEYTTKLENMLPNSKKKKLGLINEESQDETEENVEETTIDDGEDKTLSTSGTF